MSPGGPVGPLRCGALLIVVLVTVAVPGGGMHATTYGGATQIEADTTLLDLSLHEDGDADWEIRYRVRLDDENTTAAFESLEADVRENRSAYTDRFETRITGTVSAAENATGREMSVQNVSVRTERQEIPQRYGLLVYSFEWTGFAEREGSEISAGDAIGGLYLDGSTSLTIGWPSGYTVGSLNPTPDETGDRSATWRGPAEFTAEQPRLVVTASPATSPSPSLTPSETGTGANDGAASSGLPPTTLLAAVIVLAGIAGAVWWWRHSGESASSASDGPDPGASGPPEELLSNEERVLRLLEENGGRMKQQQVVEELGWTDAKTSQVVGDLRESGEIEGFRLGRENVLSLPEVDEVGEE